MLARLTLGDEHASRKVHHRGGDDMGRRFLPASQPFACCRVPWQCLYLRPDPQGQGSLRPTFGTALTKGAGAIPRGSISMTLPPAPAAGAHPEPSAPGTAIGEMASACSA